MRVFNRPRGWTPAPLMLVLAWACDDTGAGEPVVDVGLAGDTAIADGGSSADVASADVVVRFDAARLAGPSAPADAGAPGPPPPRAPPPDVAPPPDATPGCVDDDECGAGEICVDGGCVACPAGDANCPCGANGFCGGGLVCEDDVCREPGCVPGEEGCPCDEEACAEGQSCGDDDVCHPCTPEVEGCPCDEEGLCGEELVCHPESETCEVPEICADLPCLENQLCREPELAGEVPRCLERCADGFEWNDEDGGCDPEPPPGEVCDPDAVNTIAPRCAEENRACVEPAPAEARCGDCLAAHIEEGGACRAVRGCEAIDCPVEGRICVEGDGVDAACGACAGDLVEEDGACVEPPGPSCEALGCRARNRVCVPEPEPACGACLAGYSPEGEACVLDVSANCEPGVSGSILEACAADQRACVGVGEGAVCGGCLQGFTESLGVCVPEVRCADLDCALRGRACHGEPLAECGDCAEGFIEQEGECVATRFCADLDCLERGRTCDGEPLAACGGCAPGTRLEDPEDPEGLCVSPLRCADIACQDGEFCIEGRDGADASCADSPCPAGEALREELNRCVVCELLCGEPGETGRVYPYTQAFSDNCVCETESGFYADVAGAIRARPCDADGDGWVRISAQASLESDDEAIRANARCDLREVDRVVFRNEYGQYWGIRLCEVGLRRPWEGACEDVRPTPLYESVRNDDAVELGRDPDAPPYVSDGVGRALRPAELNPLTKGCVSPFADYNDNGLADVAEHQRADAPEGLDPALAAWLPFTHFVELHTVAYSKADNAAYGQLVIGERSRCADRFPLQYAEGEGGWWRQCMRNRPSNFASDPEVLAPVGYDFAQYNCGEAEGGCALRGPPTNQPTTDEVPSHGLCQVARPFIDDVWRGVNHASQFRCVQVSAEAELPQNRGLAPQRVLAQELYNGVQGARSLQLNRCWIDCPDGDRDCAADCDEEGCARSAFDPGGRANPSVPHHACEPALQDEADQAIPVGTVGFAAVRYIDSPGSYARGCINEWEPGDNVEAWKGLCPGYDANPRAVVGAANAGNFGRLLCGCGFGYGGPECEVGCPERRIDTDGDGTLETDAGPLHYGGDAANVGPFCADGYCPINGADVDGGRLGFWLCGDTSVTSNTGLEGAAPISLNGGGFSLRGGVSPTGLSSEELCQGDDCNVGWAVRRAGVADR